MFGVDGLGFRFQGSRYANDTNDGESHGKENGNEMETRVIQGLYRDPSMQIIPTLGTKSANITYIELFPTANVFIGYSASCVLPVVRVIRL